MEAAISDSGVIWDWWRVSGSFILLLKNMLTPKHSGCAISCIRLHSLLHPTPSLDPSYNYTWQPFWPTLELSTTIICSALLATRPLLTLLFPSLLPNTHPLETSHHSPHPTSPPPSSPNRFHTVISAILSPLTSHSSLSSESLNTRDRRHDSDMFLEGYVHRTSREFFPPVGSDGQPVEMGRRYPASLRSPGYAYFPRGMRTGRNRESVVEWAMGARG